MALADLGVRELVRVDGDLLVYRARAPDGGSVLLRCLAGPHPPAEAVAQLEREYRLLRELGGAGTLEALGLEHQDGLPVLVLEDFPGRALAERFAGGPPPPETAVALGVRLCRAVAEVHRRGITHRRIAPDRVLVDEAGTEVRLAGLDAAGRAEGGPGDEVMRPRPGLAYLAPEQTGRTGRGPDRRSDLYSLGATLYWLLTGHPPFRDRDPLSLVHAHVARMPELPQREDGAIPAPVAQIVLKLLAKAPEARYQSAGGVAADLEHCLHGLRSGQGIRPFPLGRHDESGRFRLSGHLYGRDREAATLRAAIARADSGGRCCVIVEGAAGLGKTFLISEMVRTAAGYRTRLAAGKAEQFNREVPFAAVTQALRNLFGQLLTEDEGSLAVLRARLAQALGANGQVLVAVVPELEHVIGPQPEVQVLPPVETENRFRRLVQLFFREAATADRPLILYLDDLHWADAPSIRLLELLALDPSLRHLLIIGAYRGGELREDSPLGEVVSAIAASETPIETITLGPLDLPAVQALLADTLERTPAETAELAAVCLQKTHANALYLGRLLDALAEAGAIFFDRDSLRWSWDLDRIARRHVAADVVEFVAERIATLPVLTQEALSIAAVIGNRFDLATLASVARVEADRLRARMDAAEAAGLVSGEGGAFRFTHDRVQQVAYGRLGEDERAEWHQAVGRYLLAEAGDREREERLFEIVGHLNRAAGRVDDETYRDELARLNLRAGRKARASTAYQAASSFLGTGIRLLGEDGWRRRYGRTLDLHLEAAEAACLNGDFAQAERYIQAVTGHARETMDRVRAREVTIGALIARNALPQAVETGLNALRLVGVRLPRRPSRPRLLWSYLVTRALLARHRLQALAELSEVTDPATRAALRIPALMSSAAYHADPPLVPLLVFLRVALTVRHGFTPDAPFALTGFALVLCSRGQVDAGYRYGRLALALNRRCPDRRLANRTIFSFNAFTRGWREPLSGCIAPLTECHREGMECGDFEYAAYAAAFAASFEFHSGARLSTLIPRMEATGEALAGLNQQTALNCHRIFHQLALCLSAGSGMPPRLAGAAYDEARMVAAHRQAGDKTCLATYYSVRAILCYLMGATTEALESLDRYRPYAHVLAPMPTVPIITGYEALSCLACVEGKRGGPRRRLLRRARGALRRLRRWAAHAPRSHGHRVRLVEAELARVEDRVEAATGLYEQAIEGARSSGLIQEEALAWELAGRSRIRPGAAVAPFYLAEARARYLSWGARAKAAQLVHAYPELNLSRVTPAAAESLDLDAVIKLNQALSERRSLRDLVERMVAVVRQAAGAERAVLVMQRGGRLWVEGESGPGAAGPGTPEELDRSRACPAGVIRFVRNTGEAVVLDDAARQGPFVGDPAIRDRGVRSMLCLPMKHHSDLTAILYLENNLVPGAFPVERVELIRLLAGQAAVAIDNATLYDQLEARVNERTAELESLAAQLEHRAFHDPLTGLANRALFLDHLSQAVAAGQRHGLRHAVLYLDLDRFKAINDSHGHDVGDELLRQMAARLRGSVRAEDTVARLGGDEFTLLLRDLRDDAGAGEIAAKVIDSVSEPCRCLGRTLQISTSIGIARFPADATDPEGLLKCADLALYRVKAAGRKGYGFYDAQAA